MGSTAKATPGEYPLQGRSADPGEILEIRLSGDRDARDRVIAILKHLTENAEVINRRAALKSTGTAQEMLLENARILQGVSEQLKDYRGG